jgi:RNA polymerase sigma-70 factor (ECF subfamily)
MEQSSVIDSVDLQQLTRASESGDTTALASVFARYRPRLRRMVQLRLNTQLQGRIDPSDVVQDAFAEAARVLPSYLQEQPLPVHLWLRKLTGQAILQAHRKHLQAAKRDAFRDVRIDGNDYAAVSTDSLANELAGSMASPASAAIQREQATMLAAALQKLSDLDREILVLRHFEQLSGAETATTLGMNHEAVKKRYLRALLKLKSMLPSNDSENADNGAGRG